jgi:hypothetical protein
MLYMGHSTICPTHLQGERGKKGKANKTESDEGQAKKRIICIKCTCW